MTRGTGMLKAGLSLTLLLGSIACTGAAAVTHGDLLLMREGVNGTYVQVSTHSYTTWQGSEAHHEALQPRDSTGVCSLSLLRCQLLYRPVPPACARSPGLRLNAPSPCDWTIPLCDCLPAVPQSDRQAQSCGRRLRIESRWLPRGHMGAHGLPGWQVHALSRNLKPCKYAHDSPHAHYACTAFAMSRNALLTYKSCIRGTFHPWCALQVHLGTRHDMTC